jgi:ribonucleotide monophosphatase NagD (HAD superfamily)
MVHIIKNFDEISTQYKAIFCDLWGCIHNGKESFANSLKALLKYKKNGGVVIFSTN